MSTEIQFNNLIEKYSSDYPDFDLLRKNIVDFFSLHPRSSAHIHSIKSRLKDPDHLNGKIARKWQDEDPITAENLYKKITDFAGVRVLLLYQQQFSEVKKAIDWRIGRGEWTLVEPPKAYTWDPEAELYFKELGIETHKKESFYTSVHYLIKQYPDSDICCEVQIRTLFEEIWGEVDHTINYPEKTNKNVCRDQIMVLAKLIGAGSRLVDSIFASHKDLPNSLDR